jgi:hypothetical protein
MKAPFFALLVFCCSCALAHGQSLARRDHGTAQIIENATADQVLAAQAIFLLKRLDDEVIVYRSLGEFEEGGKLARVSFETFRNDLFEVSAGVEAIASRLPDSQLRREIRNALDSYRDGAFWWQKVYQPRVINVADMRAVETLPSSQAFLMANAPYTVAIHWRQARKYLQRAAVAMTDSRN